MKKKLEADLISIAHRILKMKNKSDINQLYLETQKLYEKLAILKFVDDNFDAVKPTIGRSEIKSNIEAAFENEIPKVKDETDLTLETTENSETEIIEEKTIDTSEIITETENESEILREEKETPTTNFKPSFEFSSDEVIETSKNPEIVQISFEDLMGVNNYSEAQFVKVDDVEAFSTPEITDFEEKESEKITDQLKSVSLNDKLSKGIHIDLNDRLAFIKHLFGDNSEDFNRVYNQLITFDTFSETKEFINTMVKPDYNNWEGKEDYEFRFIELIEKKFL